MDAERRSSLLNIGSTATEVVNEAERFRDRAKSLKIAYSHLAVFAGQSGGSREKVAHATVDEKLTYAATLHENVKSFADGTTALDDEPVVDLHRAQVRVTNARTELRTMREDLERDLSSVEAQIAEYRKQQIQR
jgi:hypothetical protein